MPNTSLPAYEQVKAFIKAQINNGTWRPGDAVPSESTLQAQFGISRTTANRAVKDLAVEGVVNQVKGSGLWQFRSKTGQPGAPGLPRHSLQLWRNISALTRHP